MRTTRKQRVLPPEPGTHDKYSASLLGYAIVLSEKDPDLCGVAKVA
jgi:hypothetical protein